MLRRRRSAFATAGLALVAALIVPAATTAHPLGNFTINHYAGIRVEPDRILLDVVIDQAEIPAFQARQEIDTDGDGEISDDEIEAARATACDALAGSIELLVSDRQRALRVIAAGLHFPPGVGGLATMRLVCGFESILDRSIEPGTRIGFADDSHPDRLGWREIVVEGSGVTIDVIDGVRRSESISERLTDYPEGLLDRPAVDRAIELVASPGGPELPPFDILDAEFVDGLSTGPVTAPTVPPAPAPTVIPGRLADDLPSIFGASDLTPFLLILAILVAAGLGAGHALTPGHGKTLIAAYLVGTRGNPIHALGLGLSMSVSHTLGILVLALIVVGAQGVLAPDLVVRIAPIVAAVSITAIGAWMLAGEVQRRKRVREAESAHAHAHGLEHERDHGSEHDPERVPGEHSHGAVSHRHAPAPGSMITWRSLFALGLAGGLIPSTNALLILLGAVAAGRPAFGIVLVVAFGLGMAAVMVGIGLVLVVARGRIDLLPSGSPISRVRDVVPAAAAVVVLGLGVWLTTQAVLAPPAL